MGRNPEMKDKLKLAFEACDMELMLIEGSKIE